MESCGRPAAKACDFEDVLGRLLGLVGRPVQVEIREDAREPACSWLRGTLERGREVPEQLTHYAGRVIFDLGVGGFELSPQSFSRGWFSEAGMDGREDPCVVMELVGGAEISVGLDMPEVYPELSRC